MLLDEVRNRGVMEEKTKRATFRIREAMNFDLKPRVLHGQKEVNEYLAMYSVRLLSKIEVE